MKPIPTEMRKRILNDINNGMTTAAAAQKWAVSTSFIAKLKRRVRDTGSLEPIKPKTGPKPKLLPHYELLQQIVAKTPDATIEEIREQLPVQVCPQTVSNALIRLKLVYKKNNSAPPSRTDRISCKNERSGK
jgi:transposase